MKFLKLLVIPILVLSMVVGGSHMTPPAEATPPPGWFYLAQYDEIVLTHHGCSIHYVHGQFGNNSFSKMWGIASGGNFCSATNGTRVYGWGAQSPFCTFTLQPPGCTLNGAFLQANVAATFVGSVVRFGPSPSDTVDLFFCDCP